MKVNEELPATGYAIIRCKDCAVLAKFENFPNAERALMYRRGDEVSFVPLQHDDIIGNPTMFTQMLEKAGYRISAVSDMLSS
ncbi:hypothetical protein ACEU59_09775 [Buttiauxella noackiae]|uniref:hypothetical protein n=1 Tax=Buttiauxella noackiae TaxID=82992 RepID=UPI0035A69BE3